MHPKRRKKLISVLLANGGVATTAQLERLGLLRGAQLLSLPTRTLSMNTNGKGSLRTLTFVSSEAESLTRPVRELGHRAALFELQQRLRLKSDDLQWTEVRRANRPGGARHSFPDWCLFDKQAGRFVSSVEVDVGYPRDTVRQKVIGADREWRTPGYVYATTIHARVGWFPDMVAELQAAGEVPHLRLAHAVWVDFWSPHDPYVNRPYCQKPDRSRWRISQDVRPVP